MKVASALEGLILLVIYVHYLLSVSVLTVYLYLYLFISSDVRVLAYESEI